MEPVTAQRPAVRAPVHDEPRPHWLHFSGHLTVFSTLDGTVRWMAISAAVLAPVALVTLLLPLSAMPALHLPGFSGRLPTLVLCVAVLTEAMGWWYLLAAAANAATPWRWVMVTSFCVMELFAALDATPLLLIPAVMTMGIGILAQRNKLRGRWAAIAAGVNAAIFFGLLLSAGINTLATEVLRERAYFYFLALPLILYSGVDLGETGLFLSRLALWHLHPRITPRLLWWIAMGLVVATAVYTAHLYPNDWTVAFLLAVLALGAWLTARLGTYEEPPDYFLLAFSLVFFLGPLGRSTIAIGAIAAAIVVGYFARRRGGTAMTIGLFLLIFGLWLLSGATEYALDEVITIAAFAYLIYLRARGPMLVERIMLIMFWVIGFSLLSGTYDLLTFLHTAARGAQVASAALLILALIHDIASSGTLLNHDSPAMPRRVRILMYLGYALLVSGGTVLANGTTGGLSFKFDIDSMQLSGLILLGMPLFLQQFLHAFTLGHRRISPESQES